MSDVVTKSVRGDVTVVECAGAPITMCDLATATQLVIRLSTERRSTGADVHLCNAHTLALADRDGGLLQLLRQASCNFPDGMSVVCASRLLHRDVTLPRTRVYGPGLTR